MTAVLAGFRRLWAVTEAKVKAAGLAATAVGVAIAVLNDVQNDHSLLGGTPAPVQTVLLALLPGLITAAAGWQARHTPRPDGGAASAAAADESATPPA